MGVVLGLRLRNSVTGCGSDRDRAVGEESGFQFVLAADLELGVGLPEPVMQRTRDRRRSVLLEGALPDDSGSPPCRKQRYTVGSIASHVGIELRRPEGYAGGRGRCVRAATVTMPEAPVDKTDGLEPREDDVGCAGEPAIMQPVAETTGVEGATKGHLRQRVAASDSRHHARAGLSVHYVRHGARFG